jgi:pyridoxine 5-phosphate synthase
VVSLFLDPDARQIEAAKAVGADAVELHTGQYALAPPGPKREEELRVLAAAARQVRQLGLVLHAGHGLTYTNVQPVARLEGLEELNIGHSIIARAIMVGLVEAVREMKSLVS